MRSSTASGRSNEPAVSDGKFEIKGAPAGKYNIVIWHEGVGWVNGGKNGKPITIRAGKTVEVNEKAKADE